jgi:hypothetical protein
MSFQIGSAQGTLGYNYYRTPIRKTQYQNTIANSRYVKVQIQSRTNEPNISFLESGYVATSISIVQPIHIIDGVSYDATLIIEHKSVTNQTDPFYVCLLLKTAPNARNTIDELVEGKTDFDLVLNSIIHSDNAILYENQFVKKARVAIFTTPILVGSSFGHIRPGSVYIAPYSDVFSTVAVEPILGGMDIYPIEGFQEGVTSGSVTQMAGYCTPISETDPDATNAATIMLSANSELAANSAVNTTLTTATNFFGFFLLMLFAAFATQPGYRFLLLELVLDNETFDSQMKLNRMSAVDMATSIIMFSFSFAFINYGISHGNTSSLLLGFYVFIFFLTSLIVLQYRRIFNETEYLEQFGTGSSMPSFKNVRNDLGGLVYDNVRELLFRKSVIKVGNETKTINEMSYSGILLAVIYLVFYFVLYYAGMWNSKSSFFFISIPVAFFFLSWYLVVLINHFWYTFTKVSAAK